MNKKARPYISVAISVLTAAVTVLLLIPGEQGETILSQVIEMLKALLAGS